MYNACLVLLRHLLFDVGRFPAFSPWASLSLKHSLPELALQAIGGVGAALRMSSLSSVTELSAFVNELDVLRYLQHRGYLPAHHSLDDPKVSNSYVRYFLLDGRCVLSVIEWHEEAEVLTSAPDKSSQPLAQPRQNRSQAILILRHAYQY